MFMGCNTPDEFSSLLEYLQLNGGWFPFHVQRRGACQFAMFHWGIDCPMEFTNTHLRCQLVMEMIWYKEFFLPHLTDAISSGYGGNYWPRSIRNVRGKVSLQRQRGRPTRNQGPSHT